jgi:hypothetical protein
MILQDISNANGHDFVIYFALIVSLTRKKQSGQNLFYIKCVISASEPRPFGILWFGTTELGTRLITTGA